MLILSILGLTMGPALNSGLNIKGGGALGGGGMPIVGISFAYIIVIVFYFFSIYYLYNFSVKMGESIRSASSMSMETAFENLKSHYKFIGIVTIVILSIYILALLFLVVEAAAS